MALLKNILGGPTPGLCFFRQLLQLSLVQQVTGQPLTRSNCSTETNPWLYFAYTILSQ